MSDGLATRVTREEFRVWRHYDGRARRWNTRGTRADAEQVVTELRGQGHKMPIGIERVIVTEESGGIEWDEGS